MFKNLPAQEGCIVAIPLFLPAEIKDEGKSYRRYQFDPNENYAFGRLVEVSPRDGDIIEVFSYSGVIPETVNVIVNSGQLCAPFRVCVNFDKGRWRCIFTDKNYDKYKDSDYANIALVYNRDAPVLWQNGDVVGRISLEEASKLERMSVQIGVQIERKIKEFIEKNYKDKYYYFYNREYLKG